MAKFGFSIIAAFIMWGLAVFFSWVFEVSIWATLVPILTARFVGGFIDYVGKDMGYIK
jgi:hypothetical protein